MEETTPIYNQIQENRVYAQNDAKFVDVSDFVRPKLVISKAAIEKLAAYYPPTTAP